MVFSLSINYIVILKFYKHFYYVVDFQVPSDGLSAGAIVGIVAGSCVLVILILFTLWKTGFLCRKDTTDKGKIEVQNRSGSCCPYVLIFANTRFRLVRRQAGCIYI